MGKYVSVTVLGERYPGYQKSGYTCKCSSSALGDCFPEGRSLAGLLLSQSDGTAQLCCTLFCFVLLFFESEFSSELRSLSWN